MLPPLDHQECHSNTVRQQLQYNVWAGLLEQIMFQLAPEGPQWIRQSRVVRQAYSELVSLAATGKTRLPTVDNLTTETTRWMEPAERSAHRLVRSPTRRSVPR